MANVFDRDQGAPEWPRPGQECQGHRVAFGQRVKTSYITSTKIFTPFHKLSGASIHQQVSGSCWVMWTSCQASTQWADGRAADGPPVANSDIDVRSPIFQSPPHRIKSVPSNPGSWTFICDGDIYIRASHPFQLHPQCPSREVFCNTSE